MTRLTSQNPPSRNVSVSRAVDRALPSAFMRLRPNRRGIFRVNQLLASTIPAVRARSAGSVPFSSDNELSKAEQSRAIVRKFLSWSF